MHLSAVCHVAHRTGLSTERAFHEDAGGWLTDGLWRNGCRCDEWTFRAPPLTHWRPARLLCLSVLGRLFPNHEARIHVLRHPVDYPESVFLRTPDHHSLLLVCTGLPLFRSYLQPGNHLEHPLSGRRSLHALLPALELGYAQTRSRCCHQLGLFQSRHHHFLRLVATQRANHPLVPPRHHPHPFRHVPQHPHIPTQQRTKQAIAENPVFSELIHHFYNQI